jgi:hypothetical protein
MLHYLMYDDDDDENDVHNYEGDLYDFVEFQLSLEYIVLFQDFIQLC